MANNPPDPPVHVADALAHLAKVARRRPTLAGGAELLTDLLPRLFGTPVGQAPPRLDPDTPRDKLAGGVPLLRGEKLPLDASSFHDRWLFVCDAIGRRNAAAHAIAAATDRLAPEELLAEVLAGRPQSVPARADDLGLDAALTATILRLTAFPLLAHVAAALTALRQDSHWDHGHCPTCGSAPLLGEFRGLEQTRFLRCGWCASAWPFARLRCPLCDNRDHRRLGFLQIEGEEARCRAATCDDCRGYIKMIFTLDAQTAPMLLVHDLATIHLDLAAAERGYFV